MILRPRLLLLLAIAGCTTAPKTLVLAPPPPPPPGLARIIGVDAGAVTGLLGPASLDRSEGPARQLQFVRPVCVLDVFLYPGPAGAPVVRTAAARKPDGSRIDPGACLALLLPPPVAAPPPVPAGRVIRPIRPR